MDFDYTKLVEFKECCSSIKPLFFHKKGKNSVMAGSFCQM